MSTSHSDLCNWLHDSLDALSIVSYPFDTGALPKNGIYFFYEKGERRSHDESRPRIVRVGTHRDGNFRSRIAEHFVSNERKMRFTQDHPSPHDRSIFRKHIGRALLNKTGDPYLSVWDLDFTTPAERAASRHLRDISKEVAIESEITRILRETFSFRFIEIAEEVQRMGGEGLERALIGTLSSCPLCGPSDTWLGNHSPNAKIRESGLWLVQHLSAASLSLVQVQAVTASISQSLGG
jgi:hypothetical protein